MLDLEIRERIARYTRGDLGARELEDWLEGVVWGLDTQPEKDLAATALSLLVEHANGDWTDAELRGRLGALSRTYWFDHAPRTVISGSIARVTRLNQSSGSAGIRPATASV